MNTNNYENFIEYLKSHGWHSKRISKLNQNETKILKDFIQHNYILDTETFEKKLNRYFLDQKDKPKNWPFILEFWTIYNSWRA